MSSVRRKLAIASWSAPREGNIYGTLRLDATSAQRYIAHLRESTGCRVSITHLVGKAVGMGLARAPDLNGRILWGRYIPHKAVAAAFLVSTEDGRNLAKVKIDGLDQISCREICETLRAGASRLHRGEERPPAAGLQRASLAGLVCAGVGAISLIYGSLVEGAASPSAGDGIIAGLLGGLAASLGRVFVSSGWFLLGVGTLVWLVSRWWRSRKSD